MAKIRYEPMLMHGITMLLRTELEYAIAFSFSIPFTCYEFFVPLHRSILSNSIEQNHLLVFNVRTAAASLVTGTMDAS